MVAIWAVFIGDHVARGNLPKTLFQALTTDFPSRSKQRLNARPSQFCDRLLVRRGRFAI